MLQIKIIAAGNIKEKYLKNGLQEYSKRLNSYVKLEIIEVEDEACPGKGLTASEEKIKQKEGLRLLKHVSEQDYLILLDLKGKNLSSLQFAQFLEDRALEGQSRLAFIIGGSLGVSPEVYRRADFCWCLSALTFPHQLVRLLLLEQIYRACRINQGEPYHK